MKVLLVKPLERPKVVEIKHTLKNLQKLVGGIIEAVYPWDDEVALVCNDNGIAEGLPLNRMIGWDSEHPYPIFGTFFICGINRDGDDFDSLSDELVAKYGRMFRRPEYFMRVEKDGKDVLLWMQVGKGGAKKAFDLN